MKPSLLGVSIACLFAGASFTAALAQEGGVIIDQDRADRRPPSVDAPPAPARERGHVETPAAPFTPFVLQSIEVEGASLPPSAFDAAIASMRGDTIDAANLSQLADAISGVYAESDIALYTILVPPQDFANGHVRLQAIEGHVSNVALSGDTRRRHHARAPLRGGAHDRTPTFAPHHGARDAAAQRHSWPQDRCAHGAGGGCGRRGHGPWSPTPPFRIWVRHQ